MVRTVSLPVSAAEFWVSELRNLAAAKQLLRKALKRSGLRGQLDGS
jgi:transposase-like protein